MRIKRNRDFIYLTIIYIVSVTLYVYIAKTMTIPIYRWVDEDLHIALAKSFHYHHNFWRNYQPVGEYSVLYSIFLSIAYFFYTPESIVDIMRLISLAAMCTVVYPIYLLAGHMLNKKSWIWCITIFSVFVPELFYGMYLLQETLAYPLMIWTVYLIYRKFSRDEWKPGDMIIPILLAITFWTKTSLIVVAIAYYITEFGLWIYNIHCKKDNQFHVLRNICASALFFGVLVILSQVLIGLLNGFQSAESHYVVQISQIFPVKVEMIKRIVEGFAFYLVFLLLTFGILPIVAPFFCIKNMEKRDLYWFTFLIIGIILIILEVVITIVLPEERLDSYITRIHIRYLFYYFLPLFMLFLKYQHRFGLNWKGSIGLLLILSVGLYFMSQSYKLMPIYIDSIVWFWLYTIIGKFPWFGVVILFGEVLISLFFILWKSAKKVFCQLLMMGIGALILFLCNYNRINTIGSMHKETQEELIKITQATRQVKYIYVATNSLVNLVMALPCYTDEDIIVMILEHEEEYSVMENAAIVIPNDLLVEYQLGSENTEVVDYGEFSVIFMERSGINQFLTTR